MRTVLTAAMAGLMLAGSAMAVEPAKTWPKTWTADNGNGTFTNPLFYDEFSDPDIIRVGDDYYMAGTTMHAMPGVPILHSTDLVNWTFLSYALDKLDLGPAFRLEDGKSIYGQGIWAPCLRYHNGTFYIFSNVNGQKTQLFTATDPKGPWTRQEMKQSFHDLSVLFDDDGRAYAIWGYQGIKMVQLTDDLLDAVPGTEREIIPASAGMGEGLHFYKFNGKYFITSAWYEGRMRMPAARADSINGPYEVNKAISIDEDFGLMQGYRLADIWGRSDTGPFKINPPNPAPDGRMSLHQGGLVQGQDGEWWGFSMMDYNSVGRLTSLSPITWQDGWPYFGLPGNVGRTPRTWVKPASKAPQSPHAAYERSDDFSGSSLKPVWQWNHVPVDGQWSLSARPGYLRLNTLPSDNFWQARNTLTQRAIGPQSQPTVVLDASGLKDGDVAGLALLNRPYTWIGVEKTAKGLTVTQFDQTSGKTLSAPLKGTRVWLRADADFLKEKAHLSWSADGKTFAPMGPEFTMAFQLKTFQGVRYSLFAYNAAGAAGGHADFDAITVNEAHPNGLMRPIPFGKTITLTSYGAKTGLSAAATKGVPGGYGVEDMGLGRVALKVGGKYITVGADAGVSLSAGKPGNAQGFQWSETPYGELVLMSLVTNRFLRIDPATGMVTADSPGPQSDGKDGVRFVWK